MNQPVMKKISKFIVEKRVLFFLVFLAALIFCAFSVNKVKINPDITMLLPQDTNTRKGIALMEEEFSPIAMADVMVSNITCEKAEELAEIIKGVDRVTAVDFDDTTDHYASSSALYTVTFSGADNDPEVKAAMKQLREELSDYEVSVSSTIGVDYSAQVASEIGMILLWAVIVIIGVLLFTSKSYFEVVIMFIVFAAAALLNMGTNYWFGEISSITNSIAVILQLALAIDYAIIFCHRFQAEYERLQEVKPALIEALSYSIIEISSSSLTTISGLVALTLMQFHMGYDLGTVLIKGIVCSLLSVFLLMPGLIMVFHKPLLKTRHKNHVPSIRGWGRILTKKVPVFLIIFAIIMPFAIYASSVCKFSFADSATDRITYSEQDRVNERIHNTFDEINYIVVIVPAGDYQKEKLLLNKIGEMDGIKSAHGLSNIEVTDGKTLTDSFTPRAFSELLGVDIETAEILYALYGYEHQQYQPILGDREAFSVPFLDMAEFLFDAVDQGMVELEPEQKKQIDDLRGTLTDTTDMLRGTDYVRMVLQAKMPVQGEESYELVRTIDSTAKELYGEDVLVIGDITSAMDLENSFRSDNRLVSILSILFVFIVLFFTFRSFGASVLLILAIQGSIWINFSFPLITGRNIFFVAYLIIVAIQMGATIDYAIVLYNRFRTKKETMEPKEAMVEAVNESFSTIITSGTIMMAAGFLIGYLTTDLYVASIGLALGRGTLISIIVVLSVLPQLLLFGNKFMEKTTVNFRKVLGGDADEKND